MVVPIEQVLNGHNNILFYLLSKMVNLLGMTPEIYLLAARRDRLWVAFEGSPQSTVM